MPHRRLGRTDLVVGPRPLPTVLFGTSGDADHQGSVAAIRAVPDAGTDVGWDDAGWTPPMVADARLRRRPAR